MVSVHNSINKRHTLSPNCTNLNSNDNKNLKKVIKGNRMKRRNKHFLYDIYNQIENDFIGKSVHEKNHLKRKFFSFSQYEEQVVPKIQNNTKRLLRNKSFLSNSEYMSNIHMENEISNLNCNCSDYNKEALNIEYGSLIGNKKVSSCVKDFLKKWPSFISDIDSTESNTNLNYYSKNEINDYQSDGYLSQEDVIKSNKKYTAYNKENNNYPENSGYLTPTSQKDDTLSFDGTTIIDSEESYNDNYHDEIKERKEEEEFLKLSPVIIDNFDDICPFENDYFEDERIRKVLNSEVLPNDYIGKIPSVPERPIGKLGKLMEKYNI